MYRYFCEPSWIGCNIFVHRQKKSVINSAHYKYHIDCQQGYKFWLNDTKKICDSQLKIICYCQCYWNWTFIRRSLISMQLKNPLICCDCTNNLLEMRQINKCTFIQINQFVTNIMLSFNHAQYRMDSQNVYKMAVRGMSMIKK